MQRISVSREELQYYKSSIKTLGCITCHKDVQLRKRSEPLDVGFYCTGCNHYLVLFNDRCSVEDMTEVEVGHYILQLELIKKHNLAVEPKVIRFMNLGSAVIGRAYSGMIALHQKLRSRPNFTDIKRTILHELLHYLHIGGHTKAFRSHAYSLGLRSWGDKSWKWKYVCTSCRRWIKKHTREKTFCSSCGHLLTSPKKLF